MKYINAADVLPKELLKEIFNYVNGELLYIPTSGKKQKWGQCSGSREYYIKRNREIINKYIDGTTISDIAKEYCLSYFEDNEKSLRAQKKCGFEYNRTNYNKPWPLMGDIRTEIITCITKEKWLNKLNEN